MHVLTPVRNLRVLRGLGSTPDDSAHDVQAIETSQRRVTNQLIAEASPVTHATSTQPVQTPGQKCMSLWTSWLRQAPAQQKNCVNNTAGATKFKDLCTRTIAGTLSSDDATDRWNAYVRKQCGTPPPATRPPVPPPTTSSPPWSGPAEPGSGSGPGAGGGPGGDSSDEGLAAKLRQVGPVVGLGLLLAIGLTVARKRKLTRRR